MRRVLALLVVALAAAPAAADTPLYGRTIEALRFEGDAAIDEAALARVTDLRPGQTLTEAAVRTAMRNLFATRRFADLAIAAAPAGEKVVVRVSFWAAPRIASVTLEGPTLTERRRLRDALGVEPGESWSAEKGEAAVRGMGRVLSERGYFEPRIEARVEPGPDDTSVALVYRVSQGPLARAGAPRFSGATAPYRPEQLARRLKLRVGRVFRQTRAREDAERLAAWLHREGHARAEVRFEGTEYDRAARTVSSHYAIFVGPLVVLDVTGASRSSVRNHPASPWSRGEPPDEEAVRRLGESLVRTYQEKGYARVEVDARLRTEPGEDHVEVAVRKGARFSIATTDLEGSHSLPKKEILSLLGTRPRGLLSTGRLVDREVEEDRGAIGGFYASHGYSDVRAGRPVVRDGARPFTLDVTFPVQEGPRIMVAERRLEGNARVPDERLLPLLLVTPGEPFVRARAGGDEAAIVGWYLSHGWPDARVTTEVLLEPPVPPRPLAAVVVYKVFEGEPVVFGKTVVRGHVRTQSRIVEREFAHEEGDPFALAKLMETQQALTRLGVFSRIDVTFFPTDPETRSRTVLVTLAEAKPWSLLYGVGAEYDPGAETRLNPRFSLGVSYANLFGRALVAGLEGRYSQRDDRIVGTLRDPGLFRARIPVALTAFFAHQTLGNYRLKRFGGFLEGERRLSAAWRTTLRYQYEVIEAKDVPDDVLYAQERQNRPIKISSISPGLIVDTRDDPIDPHRGVIASADAKYAFELLGTDAAFLKGLVQAAMFRPFRGTVIALSARVGAIQSFAACDVARNPTCPPNLEIPIAERFFAGGRTTHRAFPLDDLGIAGETTEVREEDGAQKLVGFGGNGLLVANLEWRVPVKGGLGVSLFVDVGNVYADWRTMSLGKLRTGVGLGLHYLTPVGPVRVEYGWKLDRKDLESAGEASFSVGYPF